MEPRMNTDLNCLKHQDLTQKIIGVFFSVYNELGTGFLESVYVEAFGAGSSGGRPQCRA